MGDYDCGFCFFFQAEDGIRDYKVTGVQTCALPILVAVAVVVVAVVVVVVVAVVVAVAVVAVVAAVWLNYI